MKKSEKMQYCKQEKSYVSRETYIIMSKERV